MEVHVAFDPVGIGFFGADGVVFTLSCESTGGGWRPFDKLTTGAHLVEQFVVSRFQRVPPERLTCLPFCLILT